MMTTDTLPLELERSVERFNRRQDRIALTMGEGDTEAGLAIARMYLPRLTEGFRRHLGRDLSRRYSTLKPVLIKLGDEVLALATLQAAFHSIASGEVLRSTYQNVGTAVATELWALEFRTWSDAEFKGRKPDDRHKPRIDARVAKAAKKKHGPHAYRLQAGRALASREGFREEVQIARLMAGAFCVGVAQQVLPELFEVVTVAADKRGFEYRLTFTNEALGVIDQAIWDAVKRKPAWLPVLDPPRPWTDQFEGGTYDSRLQPLLPMVRRRQKDTIAAVRSAMRRGSMKPTVDALNALQAVPWAINQRVLGVMQACIARGIAVKGLTTANNVMPEPAAIEDWDAATDDERMWWRRQREQIVLRNLRYKCDVATQAEDIRIAEGLAEHDRFYTPMNLDWRGRVYPVPSFNFQRDDRVRSLFLFADGEPLGEEGLFWVKVHLANCGDFGKISKQPFEERARWVDQNIAAIEQAAIAPLGEMPFWTTADKPFLFLAACFELVSAMAEGSSFITRLPVSFDGSCSGLQHLCAMTRAPEGHLVNLTVQERPADVYQVVADQVRARIASEAAAGSADTAPIAKLCLAFGIDRGLVKRNVMTYSYSSKRFGMAQQHMEDTMRPLKDDVLEGKIKEHPFGKDHAAHAAAAKYLAGHIYTAIEEVVHLPAQAMRFLQQLAKAMAHEGKPIRWTTPCGLPWINRYHEAECKRITLWMHDRGVEVPIHPKIAIGEKKEIDKERAANGVAPNFVHALDACHLLLVVNASVAEGVASLATVHDSFGCLASRAQRFRKIIREQFVALYKDYDPLADILRGAKADLTPDNHHRLPALPERGPLNIEEVLDAEFAFA